MKILLLLIFTLTISITAYSQKPREFGQITENEFKMVKYGKDNAAKAVILYDYGETIVGRNIIFKTHRIVKIFEDDEFSMANIIIPYPEGTVLKKLNAVTYNVVDGQVVTSNIDIEDVFTNKEVRGVKTKKFSMPDIKPGSIIEYYYETTVGNLLFLNNWTFQSRVPTIWSEYRVNIQDFVTVKYKVLTKGFIPIQSLENKKYDYHFLAQNIPAFVEEKYLSSRNNYIAGVDFELGSTTYGTFYANFEDIRESLMNNYFFGEKLHDAHHLKKQTALLKATYTDEYDHAKAIFRYVKKKTSWNNQYNLLSTKRFKEVISGKPASSADINLLLTSLYKAAGFEAWPVILSTRNNGHIHPVYPFINKYNTVICRLKIDNEFVLVDATNNFLPFAELPEQCLNGRGRLITDKETEWVDLVSKGKRDITISGNFNLLPNGELEGSFKYRLGGYDAMDFRTKLYTRGMDKLLEDYDETDGWEILDSKIIHADSLDSPVVKEFTLKILDKANYTEKLIIIDPILTDQLTINPFKLEKREYPVDFVCPQKKQLLFKIKVPTSYTIDQLPDSRIIALPNKAGLFSYSISSASSEIIIVVLLKINQVVFDTKDYEILKEFFSQIILTENQQIVLTKRTSP